MRHAICRWIGALLVAAFSTQAHAQFDLRRALPFQPGEQVEVVKTGRGVTVGLLIDPTPSPRALVLLFPGGDGSMGITPTGFRRLGGNFLIRTRALWRERNVIAVSMDAPSDAPSGLNNMRGSADHATDIGDVVARLREEFHVPIWLIGTSRGTQSVANAASRLPNLPIAGIVLTSPVTTFPPRGRDTTTVYDSALDRIAVPIIITYHAADECRSSPADGSKRLADKLSPHLLAAIAFQGGNAAESEPCEAFAPHGYFGIEKQVIDALAAKISAP